MVLKNSTGCVFCWLRMVTSKQSHPAPGKSTSRRARSAPGAAPQSFASFKRFREYIQRFSQSASTAAARRRYDIAVQVGAAIRISDGRGFVVRRSANRARCRDVTMFSRAKPSSVIRRSRLVREARFVQRWYKKYSRTIAGKHCVPGDSSRERPAPKPTIRPPPPPLRLRITNRGPACPSRVSRRYAQPLFPGPHFPIDGPGAGICRQATSVITTEAFGLSGGCGSHRASLALRQLKINVRAVLGRRI